MGLLSTAFIEKVGPRFYSYKKSDKINKKSVQDVYIHEESV